MSADSDARSARKLKDVLQDLNLLAEQKTVEGFFKNAENASKLSGVVEDVRDAIMGYQVCILDAQISDSSDSYVRLFYSKISIERIVSSL